MYFTLQTQRSSDSRQPYAFSVLDMFRFINVTDSDLFSSLRQNILLLSVFNGSVCEVSTNNHHIQASDHLSYNVNQLSNIIYSSQLKPD